MGEKKYVKGERRGREDGVRTHFSARSIVQHAFILIERIHGARET